MTVPRCKGGRETVQPLWWTARANGPENRVCVATQALHRGASSSLRVHVASPSPRDGSTESVAEVRNQMQLEPRPGRSPTQTVTGAVLTK